MPMMTIMLQMLMEHKYIYFNKFLKNQRNKSKFSQGNVTVL